VRQKEQQRRWKVRAQRQYQQEELGRFHHR
jgi:hypothetical protein